MENEKNELKQSQALGGSSGQGQNVAESSRRRLLSAGLKAAPVIIATLASRPSLACDCIVPSAWGSINAALGGKHDTNGRENFKGSLIPKNALVTYVNDPLDFRNFKDFTSVFSPNVNEQSVKGWAYLTTIFSFPVININKNNTRQLTPVEKIRYVQGKFELTDKYNAIAKLKVPDLCRGIGISTIVGTDAMYPWAMVNGGYSFGASMLIALVNQKKPGTIPPACIPKNDKTMLNEMALKGRYTPAGSSVEWLTTDIEDYLHFNWFARRFP